MTTEERRLLKRIDETLMRLLVVQTAELGLQVKALHGSTMLDQKHRAELHKILTSTSAYVSRELGSDSEEPPPTEEGDQ